MMLTCRFHPRRLFRSLAFLCLFLCLGVPARADSYTIIEVIDGDTIVVANDAGKQIRVKMIGIDAPELHDTKKARLDAQQGKAGLGEILGMGQRARNYLTDELDVAGFPYVYLEFDHHDLDSRGNTLAYVHVCPIAVAAPAEEYVKCPKCITTRGPYFCYMLNALILYDGYARTAPVPPNSRHSKMFDRLYKQARREKRGLWTRLTTGKPVLTKVEYKPTGPRFQLYAITREMAVDIAQKHAIEKGYAVSEGGATINAIHSTVDMAWLVTMDFAPSGGGKHLNIWVHHNSGNILQFQAHEKLR